jgi:hypothetical protein
MEQMGGAAMTALDNARATKRRRETRLVNKVFLRSGSKNQRCHGVVGSSELFSTSHKFLSRFRAPPGERRGPHPETFTER